jgi:predicted Zn-dependent peptidase
MPHLYLAWPAPALGEPGTLAVTALAALLGDDGAGLLATSLFMQGQPPLPGVMFSVNTEPGVAHLAVEVDLDPDQDPAEVRDRITAALSGLGDVSVPADRLEEWVLAQRTAEALLLEKPHYFGMSHAGDIVHTGFDAVLGLQARLKALAPADLQAVAPRRVQRPARHPADPARSRMTPAVRNSGCRSHVEVIHQPSGLTLIADSTSESGVFALQLMLMHRSAWEGPRRAGAIDLLHRLWADSPQALQLARMGAQLKFHDAEAIPYDDHYTSPAWSFVRMETLSDKALPACELLLDLLRNTPLEESAFELKRMDALRRAEQRQTSASERAADRMDEELLGSIPSALPPEGSPSSLESIRREELETLRTVILNPANLVFSTRGPVSAAALDSLLGRLLPPAPLAPETLTALRAFNPGLQPDPAKEGFVPLSPQASVTPGSYTVTDSLGSAQSAIRLGSVFPCAPENAAALRVLFAVISDRMAFDLRETRGWAYSLGAWASARKGQGQAGASMGTRPANRDAALEAMRGYLGRFDGDKLTEDEVSRTVSSLIGRERMRRMASINQAWYRALDVIAGDPERTARDENALRAVTRDDLLRVAAEVLPAMQWITVTVE